MAQAAVGEVVQGRHRRPVSKFYFYVTLRYLMETKFLPLENGGNSGFLFYRVVMKHKKGRPWKCFVN